MWRREYFSLGSVRRMNFNSLSECFFFRAHALHDLGYNTFESKVLNFDPESGAKRKCLENVPEKNTLKPLKLQTL